MDTRETPTVVTIQEDPPMLPFQVTAHNPFLGISLPSRSFKRPLGSPGKVIVGEGNANSGKVLNIPLRTPLESTTYSHTRLMPMKFAFSKKV